MPSPNIIVRHEYFKPGNPTRDYYSSNGGAGKHDFLSYMDTGSKEDGKYLDFVDYEGNPEKSSGVFGPNGLMGQEEKAKARDTLRKSGAIVHSLVISTEHKFGLENLKDSAKAERLLAKTFPKFLKATGYDVDNVFWVAALHENTDNRHIHVLFLEREPIYAKKGKDGYFYKWKGKLDPLAMKEWKGEMEKELLPKPIGFWDTRDKAVAEAKKAVLGVNDYMNLQATLSKIYDAMPEDGRVGYESENMKGVRPLVDSATDIILTNSYLWPSIKEASAACKSYDEEVKKRYQSYGAYAPREELIYRLYSEEMYRRCGNAIIKELIDLKGQERAIRRKYKNSYAAKHSGIATVLNAFADAARWSEKCEAEASLTVIWYKMKTKEFEIKKMAESGAISQEEASEAVAKIETELE
jgi:hypothetical protein